MTATIDRARAGVRRILARFPSVTVTLQRPERDAYEQPTGVYTDIAPAKLWMEGVNHPAGWRLSETATVYDDQDAVWAVLICGDAPEARHGDRVLFPDGKTRTIRNIYTNDVARVFWQLEDA